MISAAAGQLNTRVIGTDLAIIFVILSGLAFLYWAFVPHGKVPHFRVQTIRIRLRLRLHPGRGFATAYAVWAHWGRFASFWASRRTRPGLGLWQRMIHPSFHCVFMGRAHYRLGLRLPIQEHLVVFGPPRAYKSGFLSRVITNYMGAVVSTSTKGDMLALTAGVRQHRGSQVYVFNPQRLGPFRSNIRWNLVAGCAEPAVAIRRAQALCEATSTEGTEEATFWSEQAAMQMRALLCAADLMGRDFRIVNHWILSGRTQQAEDALKKAGSDTWAAVLEQMRSGKAERTTATIRLVLSSTVSFMSDPMLAECVIPGPGDSFDIEQFLLEAGSLYLIGEQRGQDSPIAPLFSSLVTEIQFTAQQMAGSMHGQRLDPPVLFALDEVTQIVPIPLPSIVADSGGRGIQLIIAAHGIAQLRSRWGADGARTVLDCCNLMVNPGVQDPDTLKLAEELAGQEWFKVPGAEQRQQLPIIPIEAIRQLPPKRSLLIRTWNAPVAVRLAMGWRDWRYLTARVRGYAMPYLIAVPSLGAVVGEQVLAEMANTEPVVPVSGDLADFPVEEPGLEPTPGGPSAHLAGIPQPRFAPGSQAANENDNGRVNGNDGRAAGYRNGPAPGHGHPNGHARPNGHSHPNEDTRPNGAAGPQDGGPAVSDPWSER
jgi:type IV secretion system protein VirD4